MSAEEITITGAAARKIGRLSAVLPESDIRIRAHEGECGEDERAYYLTVDFRDEYDLSTVRCVVVHEDGWSNPSVARLTQEAAAAASDAEEAGSCRAERRAGGLGARRRG